MSRELAEIRMKLIQERYDLKRARVEAEGLLNTLRMELRPPALCEVEDLNLDRARDIFNDLHAKQRVVRALIGNISRLEAELQ